MVSRSVRGISLGVAMAAGAVLVASPRAARRPAPQSDSAGATVFFDDFSGPELDRSKWNVITTGRTVNNEQQAYVDSPDVFSFVHGADADGADGALAITPRYTPGFKTPEGRSFDFTSARLDTRGKVEVTYGTIAVRAKVTPGVGVWPAFWVLGTGQWPATGEIDILESVGQPEWTNIAMHGPGYSGNTPITAHTHFSDPAGWSDWHVYSVDWTATGMVFRLDGADFYRVTKTDIEKYGPWAYDNPKYLILNVALGGQYPQAVNHTTAPYPGLPQATVDLIKANDVRMLVDWVKVTRNF